MDYTVMGKMLLSLFSYVPIEIGIVGIPFSYFNKIEYLLNDKGRYYKVPVPFMIRLKTFIFSSFMLMAGICMNYPLANHLGFI